MRNCSISVKYALYLIISLFFLSLNTIVCAQTKKKPPIKKESAELTKYYIVSDIVRVNEDEYVAGSYDDHKSIFKTACYWKNGKLFLLADSSSKLQGSYTAAMAVNESNDIFILGALVEEHKSQFSFTCWKNGKWNSYIDLFPPTSEDSNAYMDIIDMAAYKSDIYILASFGDNKYYWENGNWIQLTTIEATITNTDKESKTVTDTSNHYRNGYVYARALQVYNGDVYVAGSIQPEEFYRKPVYWKNGQYVKLPLPKIESTYVGGDATDIFVNEKGVWISGTYKPSALDRAEIACYWGNGELKELSPSYAYATATTIFMKDSDVYVTGGMSNYDPSGKRMACYWKNGQEIPVFETNNSSLFPAIISLSPSAMSDPMLYIATELLYTYGFRIKNASLPDIYKVEDSTLKPLLLKVLGK